jgi:predicted N-acyltransferase
VELKIVENIREVEENAWNRLVPSESVLNSYAYYRILEMHLSPALQQRYALFFESGTLRGAAVLQTFRVHTDSMLHDTKSTPWVRTLRDTMLSCIEGVVTVVGNLYAHGTLGVLWDTPSPPYSFILEAIAQVVFQGDPTLRSRFLIVKDLLETDVGTDSVVDSLRSCGFWSMPTEPDMRLQFSEKWTTFSHYLDALNSKYRKAVLRTEERLAESGCCFRVETDLTTFYDKLYALYTDVSRRAKVQYPPLQPGYLPALAATFGPDKFRCSVLWKDDTPVAYCTLICEHDVAYAHYLGYSRETARRLPLYPALMYRLVHDSMAMGCRTLSLGRTALEAKARLGAVPVPMSVWIRHRCRALNVAVRPWIRMIPSEAPPERHPFAQSRMRN